MTVVLKEGKLYVKILSSLPFFPFGGLSKKSVLLCSPYGDVTRKSYGKLYRSLLFVTKGVCRYQVNTWQISRTPASGFIETFGKVRRATDRDIRRMLMMLMKSSQREFSSWLSYIDHAKESAKPNMYAFTRLQLLCRSGTSSLLLD